MKARLRKSVRSLLHFSMSVASWMELIEKLRWAPHLKDIALRSILTLDSAHPCQIHGGWIRAYFNRIRSRSFSPEIYSSYQAEVCSRLVSSGIDPSIVQYLRQHTGATHAVPISNDESVKTRQKTFWCVLPYHPVWFRALNASARRFSERLKAHPIESIGHRLAVSWSLTGSVLSSVIRKF